MFKTPWAIPFYSQCWKTNLDRRSKDAELGGNSWKKGYMKEAVDRWTQTNVNYTSSRKQQRLYSIAGQNAI